MRFVIVTGISGAGKSTALKFLEDAQYFCVDNLPILLLEKFASMTLSMNSEEIRNVALGVDVRSGQQMRKQGYQYEILFLDASDEVLIKRYKESRRNHPLAPDGRVDEGIRLERRRLEFLRNQADYIINTSRMLTRELRKEIVRIFVDNQDFRSLVVSVVSFGFKYGIPSDADLVFDVRFLPNPYYIDELRHLTGEDQAVFDYVMGASAATEFADKLEDMVKFLIPHYMNEGKNSLVIGIGCTGGKHRSVTIAEAIYQYLSSHRELGLKLEHRDIEKCKRGTCQTSQYSETLSDCGTCGNSQYERKDLL